MTITSKKEAVEAINAVSRWLSTTNDEDLNSVEFLDWDTKKANLARDFSHRLLNAARANGLHGCKLCQS